MKSMQWKRNHLETTVMIDTGCTHHICKYELKWKVISLTCGKSRNEKSTCWTAISTSPKLLVIGTIMDITLIAEVQESFISVTQLESKGAEISIKKGVIRISVDGKAVMQGTWIGKLYYLKVSSVDMVCAVGQDTWHCWLGHTRSRKIARVLKSNGIQNTPHDKKCETCLLCKSRKPLELLCWLLWPAHQHAQWL